MHLGEQKIPPGRAGVLVAHPDDETLWAGGTILMQPSCEWSIVALCRASDSDRAPRFSEAVRRLGARGHLLDLDDGSEQKPLASSDVDAAVQIALGSDPYEVILTHSPLGEYTRHRRHEEVGLAAARLWQCARLSARELWLFAYADDGSGEPPEPIGEAHVHIRLTHEVWQAKRQIVEDCYGFGRGSFEYSAASQTEAFWRFSAVEPLQAWLTERQLGR
jgi:LmbE family N-acetylglucosaminyl deacetylase